MLASFRRARSVRSLAKSRTRVPVEQTPARHEKQYKSQILNDVHVCDVVAAAFVPTAAEPLHSAAHAHFPIDPAIDAECRQIRLEETSQHGDGGNRRFIAGDWFGIRT